MPTVDLAEVVITTSLGSSRKRELLGSWGSMVAKLKLKGIDGRAPQEVENAA